MCDKCAQNMHFKIKKYLCLTNLIIYHYSSIHFDANILKNKKIISNAIKIIHRKKYNKIINLKKCNFFHICTYPLHCLNIKLIDFW